MIALGAEQLLLLVLIAQCVLLAIASAVFAMVLRATAPDRGRWWLAGWVSLALALGTEAAGLAYSRVEMPLSLVATILAIAAGWGLVAGSYQYRRVWPVPAWAYAVVAAGAAAALTVSWRADVLTDLAGPEVAIFAAMLPTAIVLYPFAGDRLRRRGNRSAWIAAVLLALFIARTLVSNAVLAGRQAELSPLYWSIETFGFCLLAIVLATSQVVMLLDELHEELHSSNLALTKALEDLEAAAKIDPLTGLYNRYAFYSLIDELRLRNATGGCVIMLDVNYLKSINDTYGHHTGDRALLNVAERIRGLLRATDHAFRWGGDEFVVLLFGVAPEIARERAAEMERIEPLHVPGIDAPVPLHSSWGVAPFEPANPDAALREADANLYAQRRLTGARRAVSAG